PDILVTEGPFKFTRNPIYLGFLLVLVGFAWCFGVISVWVGPLIFLLLANFWYIPFEEKRMLKKFGESYVEYRQKVRRWL
ncbi:MAG: isoprenylcysteine carboxylmethyltransferase family protein, partial [Opitutales bacterium]|nr:isoprenylcysteine carboxylmethyltransferase family protein [Opitutales bacterium]